MCEGNENKRRNVRGRDQPAGGSDGSSMDNNVTRSPRRRRSCVRKVKYLCKEINPISIITFLKWLAQECVHTRA